MEEPHSNNYESYQPRVSTTIGSGTVTERDFFEQKFAAVEEMVALRVAALEATIARDIVTLRELNRVHAEAHEREHRNQQQYQEMVHRTGTELQSTHADAHAREHAAVQMAINKAEEALGIRLESMNQFRSQIERERVSYVQRDQLDERMISLSKNAETRDTRLNALEGHAAQGQVMSATISALDAKVDDVKARLARVETLALGRQEARDDGRATMGELRGWVAAGVSLMLFVIALIGLALKLAQ